MSDGEGDYLYRMMRDPADDAAVGVIDIGHDVRIMFSARTVGGPRTGLFESHPAPDGRECGGPVTFDVPEAEGLSGPRWIVESWDPLTISPSVLCRTCGHHGWIKEGRWIPC